MNDEISKIFQKVGQGRKSKRSHNKFFFPDYKAEAFFKALSKNTEKIEELANFLQENRNDILDTYNEYFLTIAVIFRSFFQVSSKHVRDLISNPENEALFQNFKLFSNNLRISKSHLDHIKSVLREKKDKFVQLILEVEKSYVEVQQKDLIGYYCTSFLRNGEKFVPGSEKILELVPWHQYFSQSIFEWDDYYSPMLMYKLFAWSRLEKVDGCLKMRNAIYREVSSTNKNYILFGQTLGFVGNIPEKNKIYNFFYELNEDALTQTKETLARFLIKTNVTDPLILTVDSTSAKGQENDPAFSSDVKPNSNRKKTHKIHTVCDGNGIPLLNYRTQGEMNDQKGFKKYKVPLLRLKEIADEEGVRIIGLALDSSFASKENMQWISEELKVTPIPWPMNPPTGEMEYFLHWLENLRKRFRFLKRTGLDTSPDALLKDEVYVGILEKIETICEYLILNGTDYARFIGELFLEIGIHEWFTIYRRRGTIEGSYGIIKSSYYLLKRTPSQSLPVVGKENVQKHASLVIIAMQINAIFRYLILKKKTGILKPTLAFKISELELDL